MATKTAEYYTGGMHNETTTIKAMTDAGYIQSSVVGMVQGNQSGCGFIKITNVDKENMKCTIKAYTGAFGYAGNVVSYSNPAKSSVFIDDTEYYTLTRMSKDGSTNMSSSNYVSWSNDEFQPFTKGIIFDIPLTTSERTVTVQFFQDIELPDNASDYDKIYMWAKKATASLTIPAGYTAPKGFSISVTSKTSTSVTVKATWTEGSGTSTATVSIGKNSGTISSSGGTTTLSGLTPNTSYSISGSLADGTTTLTSSTSVLTNIVAPSSWTSTTSTTSSITVAATSSNGGSPKYQYRIQKNGSWLEWQDSGTFSSLSSNTKYSVEARCVNKDDSSIKSGSLSGSVWTYPVIVFTESNITLPSGQEHNSIKVNPSAQVSSDYDQFAFKRGSGSWSEWQESSTYTFTDLAGNTEYTLYVKMKNTNSGFEAEKSLKKRTWYNPLTALKVNLKNRWFWYLEIDCSYTYNGTISKYEFAIGDDQGWVTISPTATTISHSRGSKTPTGSEKLNYNTEYNCWVRLTDNHGRTYGFSGTTHTFTNAKLPFKTLDERPLYVDGQLREVKVIKPDGTVTYITPNLLTVVKSDGTTVNMNKIINNDDRTSFQ